MNASVSSTFEQFYASTWQQAARWATALTGDIGSGEEVAQNAFLAVADRYADLDAPLPYLRRTIVNGARMAHRSERRRSEREQRLGTDGRHEMPLDLDLLAALAGLNDDQRSAVVLRYWADWTDDEIADALGCRSATVRSHLRRGLNRLRTDLNRETETSR